MDAHGPIARTGTWLFDGAIPIEVRIVKGSMRFGSGDYEDSPDIRDDQPDPTFTVWFESTTQTGTFNASGGQFPSLNEAVESTERLLKTKIEWHEEGYRR